MTLRLPATSALTVRLSRVRTSDVAAIEPPQRFSFRKAAALVSASPGLLGGVKSQLSLQIVLNKLGAHIIPESFALGTADQFFDAEGGKDANVERAVRGVGAALAEMVTRIGTCDRGSLAA
jgi:NAD(P)H-dependent FMN reductase